MSIDGFFWLGLALLVLALLYWFFGSTGRRW